MGRGMARPHATPWQALRLPLSGGGAEGERQWEGCAGHDLPRLARQVTEGQQWAWPGRGQRPPPAQQIMQACLHQQRCLRARPPARLAHPATGQGMWRGGALQALHAAQPTQPSPPLGPPPPPSRWARPTAACPACGAGRCRPSRWPACRGVHAPAREGWAHAAAHRVAHQGPGGWPLALRRAAACAPGPGRQG